jgi:hypothetical protein
MVEMMEVVFIADMFLALAFPYGKLICTKNTQRLAVCQEAILRTGFADLDRNAPFMLH